MTDQTANRNCEKCGAGFSCTAAEGDCWCFELSVPAEARLEIGKFYTDCLCPVCLLEYTGNATPKDAK